MGFYFGWMSFYLRFIWVPLVVGLAMYVLRLRGVTVNTDPYLPFFSIVMVLWGVLFVVVSRGWLFWEIPSASLSPGLAASE